MKQVVFDGGGRVTVTDVPAPQLASGHVLVRTAYSLISSGTEIGTLRNQSTGLVQRALAHPQLIRDVAQQATRDGLQVVLDRIRGRLEWLTPVGYSLAGIVAETGPGVTGFKPGDRVACAGAEHAHHAEIVSVPQQLTVLVPEGVPLRSAAFTSVGAIALQGVRRSQAALGETVVVIGLGLLGQLTCQLLRAAGCTVIGIEPHPARVKMAERLGITPVLTPDAPDLAETVSQLTRGLGADAVIICAATASDAPVNQAFALARERGRVVLVGDVGMALEREQFYRKELDLVMSRSLGPGRYDPLYEEQGYDYPPAYVRWTEWRNMEAFLEFVRQGRVDPSVLVSAEFDLEAAPAAYESLKASGDTLAVLLRYADRSEPVQVRTPAHKLMLLPETPPSDGRISVGLIGAGAFAQAVHLPNLRRNPDFVVHAVMSRHGISARNAAAQVRATYATTDVAQLLGDPEIAVVWIVTPHDSHAELSVQALEAGKHVFVEKPLALTLTDCERVRQAVTASGCLLTVGFNRRFAPASVLAREHFATISAPRHMIYRVCAAPLPVGHWLDDPERGGGRLLGEGCHFFDWMAWFLREEPVRVWAARVPTSPESAAVTLKFDHGSVGTLIYTCAAAADTPKERVEILGGNRTAVIDDFRAVELRCTGQHTRRHRAVGKGHAQHLVSFAQTLQGRAPLAVTVDDGVRATACALAALTALREGNPQIITRL